MATRIRRFYLIALWMPLIVPGIVAAGFTLQGGGSYTGLLSSIAFILVLSGASTGVPYLLLAVWVTRWMRAPQRQEHEVRQLMWWAPLFVAAFAIPAWTLMLGIHDGLLAGFAEGVLFYGPYLLVIGYLYVGSTVAAHALLQRAGYFRDAHVAPEQAG